MAGCEGCTNDILLEEAIRRIEKLEEENFELKNEVKDLRQNAIENTMHIKQIHQALARIETSVSTIADELKAVQLKPARNWDVLIAAAITAAGTWVVTTMTGGK